MASSKRSVDGSSAVRGGNAASGNGAAGASGEARGSSRSKSLIGDAHATMRSLVVNSRGEGDMDDWIVCGVSFWWYPVWYSLATVVLGFLGSTCAC